MVLEVESRASHILKHVSLGTSLPDLMSFCIVSILNSSMNLPIDDTRRHQFFFIFFTINNGHVVDRSYTKPPMVHDQTAIIYLRRGNTEEGKFRNLKYKAQVRPQENLDRRTQKPISLKKMCLCLFRHFIMLLHAGRWRLEYQSQMTVSI